MYTSPTFTKVAAALLSAQKQIGAALKDSKNPYFKSSYADLNSVLGACKEILNNHGVVVLQPHATNERGDFVETVLLHESGEFLASSTKVEVAKQNDPQAYGSAITYASRYGLQSLLGMGAEDDDGEGAMARNKSYSPNKTVSYDAPVKSAPAAQVKASVAPKAVATPVTPTPVVAAPVAVPAKAKASFRNTKPAVVAQESTLSEDIV